MRNRLLVVAAASLFLATTCCKEAKACPTRASGSYVASVTRAVRATTDVWGRGEPTYAKLASHLHPLRFALGRGGTKLTTTGVYYLPFGPQLHVGDGSELIRRRVGGPHVLIRAGGRLFSSCSARLADGWLPILETAANGARQESFGWQGTSYVRLEGRGLQVGVLRGSGTLYARWSGGAVTAIDQAAYDAARSALVASWNAKLARGTEVVVPDARVTNAARALLVQNLTLTWRYSYGNPYEEFSFPEGVDAAQVLAEWGQPDVAARMLRVSLTRAPNPYPQWKLGEKLLGWAELARLGGPTPPLATMRSYVAKLARAQEPSGLLARERYSSDIPDQVYGLHAQAVAWAGLNAIAPWVPAARQVANRLGPALRRALPQTDFLPVRLLDGERPYAQLTQERAGSYWNLVMPYALASGLLSERQQRGVLAYMRTHGAYLMGLVRAGAYALYGRDARPPRSGTDEVYGINTARFLAQLGEARQLRLALYGHLAAGMTPGTFVSGEAASLLPLHGEWYRSMYLPPNGASNGAFLETLRALLVRERPDRLDLAWGLPARWRSFSVQRLPTSWGVVSFAVADGEATVELPPHPPQRVVLWFAGRPHDLSGRSGSVRFEVR
jgi:hypothetical protein